MNKPAIKNILANFAVHVVKCHKKGVEPNLNPWADLFTTTVELEKEAEKRFEELRTTSMEDPVLMSDNDAETVIEFIAQEKQLSKQEERAKVKKIASDYQSFKINVLELEMKLCDYIEKGKDDE